MRWVRPIEALLSTESRGPSGAAEQLNVFAARVGQAEKAHASAAAERDDLRVAHTRSHNRWQHDKIIRTFGVNKSSKFL